jgi:hypothetical protein
MEPKIVVPVNFSPAGEAIPAGQTPIYSCIAQYRIPKMADGGIAGAAMSYKLHVVMTDKGFIWNHKKNGPQYVQWETVKDIMRFEITMKDLSRLILVYDKTSNEDKKAFKARLKSFAYDVLPFAIQCTKNALQNPGAANYSDKDAKNASKRIVKWEKLYAKLEKKMKK